MNLARYGRNQKKKTDHVHVNVNVHDHVNVHVDVDVNVDGSCHAKILSRRAKIYGLVVRMRRIHTDSIRVNPSHPR